MTTPVLENHMQLLRKKDPELAHRLERLPAQELGPFEVFPSRQGPASVLYRSREGKEVTLHSRYHPGEEAEKLVRECTRKPSSHYLVLGFGLGYHVLELIRRIPRHSRVVVVEADPALFRLALEHAPLAPVLKYPGISFWVGLLPEEIPGHFEPYKNDFTLNGFTPVRFAPVCRLHRNYYAEVEQGLSQEIQRTQVSQNTRSALSRSFYRNGLANLPALLSAPGLNSLKNRFAGTPALVVSAGPSLDKNRPLLRGIQSEALIITVSTALKPLLASGVIPDFVVAIDPKDISIAAFDVEYLPTHTRLVFHPCIPPEIVNRFPGRRVVTGADLELWKFLEGALEKKGGLGGNFSVAHTAFRFAAFLGCSPLVLVGQDLGFSGPRSHCSGSHHSESGNRDIANTRTTQALEQSRRRLSAPALALQKDVFGRAIPTSRALETFRKFYEEERVNGIQVYNATEGGLPIPGLQNLSLREAINRFSGKPKPCPILPDTPETGGKPGALSRLLLRQARRLETHASRIQDWLDQMESLRALKSEPVDLDAESVLAPLLEDETSIRLLQEYLYSDFLEWNRKTYQIGLLDPEYDEARVRELKHERDLAFLPKLVKAAWWLETEFTRRAGQLP